MSKRLKTERSERAYLEYKRILQTALRRAEKNHYDELFLKYKSNLRKTWRLIKAVINKSKSQTQCYSLIVNGQESCDPRTVAEAFNTFFTNIGPSLASTIPTTNRNPLSYFPAYAHSLFVAPTTELEISNLIKSLKNTAAGSDGIPSHILKDVLPIIAPTITRIFNLSLSQGVFPHELKIARVIPIYKAGDKLSVNNYRPISLLPVLSKVLEKLMATRLMKYLQDNELLYQYQFGFRPKHGTNMALHFLVDRITQTLDSKNSMIGLALDFRKAFDTVDLQIIRRKLIAYGIRGTAFNWFDSYLSSREQFVVIGNCESQRRSIQCGVPQGSILGPILFLLYINDISRATSLNTIVFADDTTILCRMPSVQECAQRLNAEMPHLTEWVQTNRLSLNTDKTNYIVFSRSRTRTTPVKISIMGSEITKVTHFKFLGVIVDENLTWQQHINYIRSKIAKSLGIIRCAKRNLNFSTLKTLYLSFIHPLLTYCLDVWGGCGETLFQSIFRSQKKAIRLICSARRNAHTHDLFQSLNILTLKNLYFYSIAVLMYKHHSHLTTPIINELFSSNRSVNSANTRQQSLLRIPLVHSQKSQKAIRYAGVHVWNQLVPLVDVNTTFSKFKKSAFSLLNSPHNITTSPLT